MTSLDKRVVRRAREALRHYNKRIVVLLEPGDVIGMRLERSRTVYRAEIKAVYYQLAKWHAEAELARKRKEKQTKRKGLYD
jgi:hypothetical protein